VPRRARPAPTLGWLAVVALLLFHGGPAAAADALVEPEIDEGARGAESLAAALAEALVGARPAQPWLAHEVPAVRSDLAKARTSARAGRLRYQNLAFEEAVRHLRAARDAYDRSLTALEDFGEVYEVQLDLAQALIDSGLASAADAELRAIARLAPTLELDPAKRPPQLLDAFGRARAIVTAQAPARLKVESTPSATVIIDGAARGRTPVEITLPPGDHVLRVRRPGHRDHVERLRLSPSERVSRDLVLTATPTGAARERLRQAMVKGRDAERAAAELGKVVGADRVLVPRIAERSGECIVSVAVVEVRGAQRRALVVAASEGTCAAFPTTAVADIARATGTKGETYLLRALEKERRAALGIDAALLTGLPAAPPRVEGPGPTAPLPPIPDRPPPKRSWLRSPWLWTIVAVVAAGAATGLYFGLHRTIQDPDRVQVILRWP